MKRISILFVLILSAVSLLSSKEILLKNINYVDIINGNAKLGENILIRDGSIAEISGNQSSQSAQIIDCSGMWAIPGLFDSHIHIFQSGGLYTRPDVIDLQKIKPYIEEIEWLKNNTEDLLRRYIVCGITSVIDMGGPIYNLPFRDELSKKEKLPSLYITGPLISTYQPEAFRIENAPIIKVNSSEESVKLVEEQLPLKPDFIKIWYIARYNETAEQNYDIIKATIDRSHKSGLKTVVHATELNTAKLALKAGADVLAHSIDDAIDDEFIQLALANNTIIVPTLIVHKKYIDVFIKDIANTPEDFVFANPYVLGSLYDLNGMKDVASLIKRKSFTPEGKKMWFGQDKVRKENLIKLNNAGVRIATGTDAGNIGTMHGSSYFEEIKYMQDAGMSNLDILKASTINGAALVNKDKQTGSIDIGKNADIVILNSNPLIDVSSIKDIVYVIRKGNLFRRDDIILTTAEELVQMQVNGYNARNIDAFLEPYSDDVEIYEFNGEMLMNGKEEMRKRYSELFEKSPGLFCMIENRIVQDNTVIDKEIVSGFGVNSNTVEAIAIYHINKGKIAKVHFIKPDAKGNQNK